MASSSTAPITLTEADYTRVSCDAAETFCDAYYTALNASRSQLSTFYIPATLTPRPLPHISINGEVLNDAAVFQSRFENDMPFTHYEPQSLNVHVMNRSMGPLPEGKVTKKDLERNMSLTVQVSGYVRLFERKEGPMRGFSDNFCLVPNKEDSAGAKGTGKEGMGRQWVIQTQNFRFVT